MPNKKRVIVQREISGLLIGKKILKKCYKYDVVTKEWGGTAIKK